MYWTLYFSNDIFELLDKDPKADENKEFCRTLRFYILILSFLKMMFFIRIFESYGILVTVLKQTMHRLVPFLIIYFGFMFMISLSFIILGMEIDEEVLGA